MVRYFCGVHLIDAFVSFAGAKTPLQLRVAVQDDTFYA